MTLKVRKTTAKSEKQTQNGILFKNDIFLWERILKEKKPQKPKTLRKR